MAVFTLTATLDKTKRRVTIMADDADDASFRAIREVMDRASNDRKGPWALGRIELRDSLGAIVHEMDAKV